MPEVPFNILSLAGGGVRGVFQAVFLSKLESALGCPLREHFHLVSGTSTGSILGVAIALGVDLERVVDLYRTQAHRIFTSRRFSGLKKGPRYDAEPLRAALEGVYQNRQLRDCKTEVLITASCVDRFGHRVFSSSGDSGLSAVDVVLASAAAPTYFPPVQPATENRHYLDGGLWASAPSLFAVLHATKELSIKMESIRVLAVGTGDYPHGYGSEFFRELRPYSMSAFRSTLDLMFSTQEHAADSYTRALLPEGHYLRISPQLQNLISLDDVDAALEVLPPLAEVEFQNRGDESKRLLTVVKEDLDSADSDAEETGPFLDSDQARMAGLTAFFPARRYYSLRGSAGSIDGYVATARKTLVMVSINLMTGIPFDNLCRTLREKLESQENGFRATISLLNPQKAELVFAISPALGRTTAYVSGSINETLDLLLSFRAGLSSDARSRFDLRVHQSIPFGSAILIDHKEAYGRIQIETKPYKAVLNDSFAFEIAPGAESGLFERVSRGYEELLKDGQGLDELGHRRTVVEGENA